MRPEYNIFWSKSLIDIQDTTSELKIHQVTGGQSERKASTSSYATHISFVCHKLSQLAGNASSIQSLTSRHPHRQGNCGERSRFEGEHGCGFHPLYLAGGCDESCESMRPLVAILSIYEIQWQDAHVYTSVGAAFCYDSAQAQREAHDVESPSESHNSGNLLLQSHLPVSRIQETCYRHSHRNLLSRLLEARVPICC